jgi:predicted nucleotidyltransferase
MSLLSFEDLHRVFERYERIVLAYLFGSLARGQ